MHKDAPTSTHSQISSRYNENEMDIDTPPVSPEPSNTPSYADVVRKHHPSPIVSTLTCNKHMKQTIIKKGSDRDEH